MAPNPPVIACQDYYGGEEVLACEQANIETSIAKADTSGKRSKREVARNEFRYIPQDDEYQCPAGERLICRFSRAESGKQIRRYWASACTRCPIKSECTPSDYRRASRWKHEELDRNDPIGSVALTKISRPARIKRKESHVTTSIISLYGLMHVFSHGLGRHPTCPVVLP
jgi:hypothetical protein